MKFNTDTSVWALVAAFLIIVHQCESETNDLVPISLLSRQIRSPRGGGFGGGGGHGGFGGGHGGFGGGRGGFGGGRGFGARGFGGRGFGGRGFGRGFGYGGFVVPPFYFRRRRWGRSVDGNLEDRYLHFKNSYGSQL